MSNKIEYNGYIGTVEYSQEDKCFFFFFKKKKDIVTFEDENAYDIENNFKNSVDEYLKTCEELGREPQKAFKGVFNVRTGSELHLAAVRNAHKMGVSLNSYIKNLIEKDTKVSFN